MKRKTLLALAVLLTALACLFTSCSASVEPPKAEEEFGYVTFGNGGSRSLTTLYGIKNYDDLYWYYTAIKKDSFGLTGQTDGQTAVPPKTGDGKGIGSGTIRLSQGAWEFELFAYESARTGTTSDNLVYQGKSDIIVLKGGETKAVPVSVNLKGAKGFVNLSGAWFEWANNSAADGKISVTVELAKDGSDPITYFFGPLTRSGAKYTFALTTDTKIVDEGYYTCTVNAYMKEDVNVTDKTVNVDATPLATQTLGLRVYGNATTYITGNLTEGIFANVVFDVAEQDMKVFVPLENGSAEITGISVTPSGESDKTTSVVFSEGALSGIQDNATLQLDVKVTPVESANEKFSIAGVDSSNRSAFAGIDITLMQTTANGQSVAVDSFNNDSDTTARITTYIASGLNNVSVVYNGTDGKAQPKCNDGSNTSKPNNEADVYTTDSSMGSKLGYSKESGKLVFETSHFSEYYVLADCVAVNVSTNVGYSSLQQAFNDAVDGQTIRLVKPITVTDQLVINKSITFDLNSFTLTSEKPFVDQSGDPRFAVVVNSNTTIKNGSILSKYSRSIISHADMSLINVNVSTEGSANAGVNVGSYGGNLYVEGGTYTGEYAIGSFAADHSVIINGVTTNGVVYHNGSYKNLTMVIDNSTITGRSADDSCGVYISGSKTHGTLHDVTISNSIISGNTAIEVKFTDLTLNNCTVRATGELKYEKNNNGSTTSGFAVISADNSMNDENASLNGTITINGGTYAGNISLSTSGLATTDPEASYVITGGTFSDLVSAVKYATKGATIGLLNDFTIIEPIEIRKSITIEGNNKKIKGYNGESARVININDNTEDISLILKNLTIVGPTEGTYTRGISAYNNSNKLYIKLDNCTVSANYYAINIAGANDEVEVVVKNSTAVAGWCAAQTWSSNSKFTFENSTLIGNNDKTFNADGWNNFATIVINEKTNNNEFTFENCRIEANQTTGNKQYLLSVRASDNKVSLKGCEYFANGNKIEYEEWGDYLSLYQAASDLILVIDDEIIPIG